MKENRYSRTAEYMAVCRALESKGRSPERRILADPWAIHFIPSIFWRAVASFRLTSRLVSGALGWWLPGAMEYILTRARLADDLTRDLIDQGLEQLVLLGAGFDTTLLRLQDRLRSVQVFEVDHSATQSVKKRILATLGVPGKALRRQALFLAVDFEKEDFVQSLLAAGFDRSRPSLVTWLGVSYYLSPPAVARTLRQVVELGRGTSATPGPKCAVDSWLIFDYALDSVLAGREPGRTARAGLKYLARLGEPFLSGLDPAGLDSYLAGFGLQLLHQYGQQELAARYCPTGRSPAQFVRVALCSVR